MVDIVNNTRPLKLQLKIWDLIALLLFNRLKTNRSTRTYKRQDFYLTKKKKIGTASIRVVQLIECIESEEFLIGPIQTIPNNYLSIFCEETIFF
jgi:hypothetical protein